MARVILHAKKISITFWAEAVNIACQIHNRITIMPVRARYQVAPKESHTDLSTTSRSTPGELVMCQEKLVQEAVDTLLDNGIRRQPMRDGHNKVYKSFSDVIEGKEGRFRETLLGQQVDYSGRSVIVLVLNLV
ncbi:DNA-directed RNA polymerase [Lithospermum erythrorhizon]|uniref:DNA-directed RNA polymerase n=1 Tax=Lithospermum erythrorhizon TaxID=34254 RepID=A0AAV3Q0C4_LITER